MKKTWLKICYMKKRFPKGIYLAEHIGLSLAQADRYLTFLNKCIPQIQHLILDSFLPFSAVDYIGYKSTTQQKNIYHTLIEEDPVDGYIPRSRIIEIVQSEVSITTAEKGRKFVESVICCIFHLSSALFPGIQST